MTICFGQYNRRTVIFFGQSGSDNTNDTFVPVGFIQYRGFAAFKKNIILNQCKRFFCYFEIKVFPYIVLIVYARAEVFGFLQRFGDQKFDGVLSMVYSARCIDAGPDLEHDVIHCKDLRSIIG